MHSTVAVLRLTEIAFRHGIVVLREAPFAAFLHRTTMKMNA